MVVTEKPNKPTELQDFINDFQALLWRVEVTKARIDYLNEWTVKSLGNRTKRLLKDPELRKEIILEEDLHLFDEFMDKVKQGRRASVVFRANSPEGAVIWLKLIGTPSSRDPRYYSGFLLEVTDTAQSVSSMLEKAQLAQVTIERADYPVLLLDFEDKKVVAVNSEALALFGYSLNEFRSLGLGDLYYPLSMGEINNINEQVLFERQWSGGLQLLRKNREPFLAEAAVRLINHKGRRLLRLSLLRIRQNEEARWEGGAPGQAKAKRPARDRIGQELKEKLRGLTEIHDILEVFLDNPLDGVPCEGILFSDIYAKKGKVVVYHAGEVFQSMKQGEVFSYKGTIAENIERFKLDHLIVDETTDSIKAIDWALFIPKGIRSYFAKAFYTRGGMRTVMILCSTKPSSFSASQLMQYTKLYKPFEQGVLNWRKAKRKK
ncbi:MAG: PAS domain-containing protein [Proteobacteria bacterium]|nr:PAS domain-containing protein [Pseudomonadota bacterium]MBU1449420.1 PAS domain-containing protein [Pseudomonadota bacterium]MBU2470562.1 PAS domain-containing protein [Pseudomonadota bacterium]MBU2516252.1 PAS domain-containing protein [Pseudomonadota bacterium]